MNSFKLVAIVVSLIGSYALWIVLRRSDPEVEQKEKIQSVVSLEVAYRIWEEDANWEGISADLFDAVHRTGFLELKHAIALDPNAALSFYHSMPGQNRTGFAIAAAEAVGLDIYAKAKEVGFDDLEVHLMRDFTDHVRLANKPQITTP